MVVFAAVRELTEVEADECGGLDLKIVPGKRDQNYMNVHEYNIGVLLCGVRYPV